MKLSKLLEAAGIAGSVEAGNGADGCVADKRSGGFPRERSCGTEAGAGGIRSESGMQDPEITGVEYDSRRVKPGSLFVCLTGEHTDGRIYAQDALFRGAAAVVAERKCRSDEARETERLLRRETCHSEAVTEEKTVFRAGFIPVEDARKALSALAAAYYGYPSRSLTVFGVTGTNGKTTTTYMIRAVQEAAGIPCGLLGTIGYETGKESRRAERTTPQSADIQNYFYEMREEGLRACAMEVSSHGLVLSRVDHVAFDVGVFTNLTRDHLDFHKSEEEYYQAKKKLFSMVSGVSCVNIDDRVGRRLFRELREEGRPVEAFSLREADTGFFGRIDEENEEFTVITVFRYGVALGPVKVRIPGRFMAANALAAATGCMAAGTPFQAVQRGLSGLKGVPGRFQPIPNGAGFTVIVDYAHTPDALESALEAASTLTEHRILCVFGCGGDRDRDKRPMMGRAAGIGSDYCIITDDNPRNEAVETITAQIEEGLYPTGCEYEVIHDRRRAIARGIELCREGDLLLIAGKGHETYQIIGASRAYFSDEETVRELLEAGGGAIEARHGGAKHQRERPPSAMVNRKDRR